VKKGDGLLKGVGKKLLVSTGYHSDGKNGNCRFGWIKAKGGKNK
jgi:hypothetical protein